jgi:NAD-dependent SIR2 family protein deacetylase
MLVAGTSGVVFPAGEVPGRGRTAGAPVILITDGPSAVQADITLLGDASKLLPAIAERVLAGPGAPREGTG